MDPKIRDWQAKSVPLGRFSEPREQGEPCVLLFSDKASYITGSQLRECATAARVATMYGLLTSLLSSSLLQAPMVASPPTKEMAARLGSVQWLRMVS